MKSELKKIEKNINLLNNDLNRKMAVNIEPNLTLFNHAVMIFVMQATSKNTF